MHSLALSSLPWQVRVSTPTPRRFCSQGWRRWFQQRMRRGAEDQRSSLDTIEGSFDEFNAKALMLVGASSGEEERRRTEAGEKTRRREEEQERRGAPSNTWKVATLRFYLAWIAGCCSALTDSLLASLAGSLDCVGRCSRRRAAEQRRGAEEQKTRAAEEQRSIFEHMEGCKRPTLHVEGCCAVLWRTGAEQSGSQPCGMKAKALHQPPRFKGAPRLHHPATRELGIAC
ncbi:unnamed protein product [Closterium sp. NIES-64]|nr:unnamed protein product [Closterium sp. NIES-64]